MPRFQALTQVENGSCFQLPFGSRKRWLESIDSDVAWSHLVEVSTGDLIDSYHRPPRSGEAPRRPALVTP
jgi:hypothetical protein